MAERLRLRIERLSTQINGQIIKITASFGGTSALIPQEPSVDVIMEQMIQTADKNMYDSKKNGRNQVKVVDFF
jgi:GGDEF domain-containing protein